MSNIPIHDARTASPEAAHLLGKVEAQLGFIPNIFGVLANSTTALSAFIELNGCFGSSSLSDIEREAVQIAASVERGSGYCVAGHTRFAHDQQADETVVESLRGAGPVEDARLDALAEFTRALIRDDGRVSAPARESFLAAGYDAHQMLDVILGICVKTISNLTSNAFGTPLDDAFARHAWHPEA